MKKYLSRLIAALLAVVLLAAPASALTVPEALELLEEHYYYDVPDEAYQAQTLEELFDLLDPYTYYMTAEEYAAFLDSVEDTVDMVGVGVVIQFTDQGMLVDSTVSGGSAREAGIQGGDLIVAVDGVPCVPAGEEHRQLMLGAEGTKVTVTVLRDGQTRDYTLTRRAIYIPNTDVALLEGGIGYLDCNSFGTDTGELFIQALERYDSQVDYWLVDLRGNTGGYVDSALEMIAALNGPGRYLFFEERGNRVISYGSSTAAATRKPLIVLVNGGSASASELVAANVRDTGRGILIGGRTFGKGVAQIPLDESNEPDYFDGDCLKVTAARFYSASATTTDKIGVIPTLLVDSAYTEAVTAALCGGSSEDSVLCVMPEGQPFYVDPDAPGDVLAALLEALPPQTPAFYNGGKGGTFAQFTPAEIARRLGLDFHNRWFDDVEDSPYAFAINTMGTYRLLNGTAPGQFNPKGQLTRAQLCVMLARVLNVSYSGPGQFSDVPQGAWYAGSVNAMAELGLVNGVGGGKFDPDSPVTQQQFLTILGRAARNLNLMLDAYGQSVEDAGDNLPFGMQLELIPYADWAKSSVAVLAWGLEDALGGSGDMLFTALGRVEPSAPILREESAAGMYKVLTGLGILP